MTRSLAGYFAWSNRGVMLSKMISTSGTKCAPISFKIKAATRSRPTLRLLYGKRAGVIVVDRGSRPFVSTQWSVRPGQLEQLMYPFGEPRA